MFIIYKKHKKYTSVVLTEVTRALTLGGMCEFTASSQPHHPPRQAYISKTGLENHFIR